MYAFQGHNQALYYLTQLTNGFRPKSSSFAVRVYQPISNAPDVLCQESFLEAKRNCTELPGEILTTTDLPNILKLRNNNNNVKEIEIDDIQVKITKRTKKRNNNNNNNNKWNVSYVSGANFNENKQGFREIQDSTLLSINNNFNKNKKQFYGIIHVGKNSILDIQIRGFKTQRNIQNDEGNKTSITSRFLKWITTNPDNSQDAIWRHIKRKDFTENAWDSNKELTPEERVKLAFAEGFVEGQSRKSQNRLKQFFKGLQSFLIVCTIFALFLLVRVSDGGLFRMQFGEHQEIDAEMVNVTFLDVKGIEEAKAELANVIEYLKNPAKFTVLGGKLPKGVLLSGVPGTGKTLIARAVAGEAGVPFFHVAGSEFDEILVGQGAKRVRELFKAAKERAPCVIFIDEIDSVGSHRTTSALHPYANQTINQLLSEMDGFHQNEGVIVLGATNRPTQLDPALLRPGRFDVQIHIDKPNFQGRNEILRLYLSKIIHSDVDLNKLVKSTIGFTGADISNMVNQAALRAALHNGDKVSMDDLLYARDKIIMGLEHKKEIDVEMNKMVAYHESGHALVAYYNKNANNLHKVTIVPRAGTLGHTSYLPRREINSYTKRELLADLDCMMGGRVAEELIFGSDKVTVGCSGDLKSANKIAERMVMNYGMSSKVGFRVIDKDTSNTVVHEEVKLILQESYERAKSILKEHSKELTMLSEALLKYETLDFDDVKNLLEGKKMKVQQASNLPTKLDRNLKDDPVDVQKNIL
ncbi:ATP-dependent zinc metalloprotease YME1L isoform X2 [Leptopilina boulardi]|uniref:ATP-dependent zinc metalloprotease YME1L isoform X2 n=1 Tax=Leptopilina boulardi TaxID=63433 RepID=UPI0021F62F27|nr:ATP-dependent zinc metalloprotease YME1L isoform X2 [Leptopilina boulardi]